MTFEVSDVHTTLQERKNKFREVRGGSLSPGLRVNLPPSPSKFMWCLIPQSSKVLMVSLTLSFFLTWNIPGLDPITTLVNGGGVGLEPFFEKW